MEVNILSWWPPHCYAMSEDELCLQDYKIIVTTAVIPIHVEPQCGSVLVSDVIVTIKIPSKPHQNNQSEGCHNS